MFPETVLAVSYYGMCIEVITKWLYITLSNTLDMVGSNDIGR